jgi:hypothetical protein
MIENKPLTTQQKGSIFAITDRETPTGELEMVAQWVKDRARERKGTPGMKRQMAELRADKAAKKVRQQRIDRRNEYEHLSKRIAQTDFLEWMGTGDFWSVSDQFDSWLDLRIAELRTGYDWSKDI